MLNYRRLIAFSSRVHTYITVLYVALCFLFFLFLHLDVSPVLYDLLVALSSALGWTIVLEGLYLIFASLHISLMSRVLALEPLLLTLLRLFAYFVLSFLFDLVVHLNGSGLDIGVNL